MISNITGNITTNITTKLINIVNLIPYYGLILPRMRASVRGGLINVYMLARVYTPP